MGLLDSLFSSPSDQALWALGSGLLGVRRGNEGAAMMNAMSTYNSAQDTQLKRKLTDAQQKMVEMQLKEHEQKMADAQAMRSLFNDQSAYMTPAKPAVPWGTGMTGGMDAQDINPGSPAQPAALDQKLMIQRMLQSGSPALVQKAMELSQKDDSPIPVPKDTVLLDRTTRKPIFSNVQPDESPVAKLIREAQQFPVGTPMRKIYDEAISKATTHQPASNITNYGSPVPVDLPGGGIGYAQPPNRAGAPTQLVTDPATGKPLTKPQEPRQMDAAAMKQITGVKNLQGAVSEYLKELQGWKATDTFNISKRAGMGTKYNNMMLQAKEAYNLGVLNGPDLQILTSVITDPRTLQGLATPNRALAAQASELSRIMESIEKTVREVHQRGQSSTTVPTIKYDENGKRVQ